MEAGVGAGVGVGVGVRPERVATGGGAGWSDPEAGAAPEGVGDAEGGDPSGFASSFLGFSEAEGEGDDPSDLLSSLGFSEAEGEGDGDDSSGFASSFLGFSSGFFVGDGGLAAGEPEEMDLIHTSRYQVGKKK